MKIRLITSCDNPLLKRMRLVAARARRAPEDLVFAEGIRIVEEATVTGCTIVAALISERFGSTEREKAVLAAWAGRGIDTFQAGHSVVRSVSDVVTHQGVVALVRMPVQKLGEIKPCVHPLILCAWEVQDPGNLGVLIRSAAAAGASLVCTVAGTVSARNPKSVRSSAGALFRIPVVEGLTPEELLEYCRSRSISIYRTSARGEIPYSKADFQSPCAILLGNEGRGLPDAQWLSLPAVRIPMAPGIESMNVAAAGTVLLFEAYRQRTERVLTQ